MKISMLLNLPLWLVIPTWPIYCRMHTSLFYLHFFLLHQCIVSVSVNIVCSLCGVGELNNKIWSVHLMSSLQHFESLSVPITISIIWKVTSNVELFYNINYMKIHGAQQSIIRRLLYVWNAQIPSLVTITCATL